MICRTFCIAFAAAFLLLALPVQTLLVVVAVRITGADERRPALPLLTSVLFQAVRVLADSKQYSTRLKLNKKG